MWGTERRILGIGSVLSLYPPNQRGRPGIADAEADEHDEVAGFDATVARRLLQGDGYRAGDGVPTVAHAHKELLRGDLQLLPEVLQHIVIRLVEYIQVDVGKVLARARQEFLHGPWHHAEGEGDNPGPVHVKGCLGPQVAFVINVALFVWGHHPLPHPTSGPDKVLRAGAIRAVDERADERSIVRSAAHQSGRTGIPEQKIGRASG